jgi:hypothetical protein
MNEEKGLHLGNGVPSIQVWQVVFMSQALKPKGVTDRLTDLVN